MTDYSTRNIIDYAMDDNGIEFRNALYDNIHKKVSAHFELAKQTMAQNMLAVQQEEQPAQQPTEQPGQETTATE